MPPDSHKFIKQTKLGKKIKRALARVRIDGKRFLIPLSRIIAEYVENSKWVRFKRDLLFEYRCRNSNPPRVSAMLSVLAQIEVHRDAMLRRQRLIGCVKSFPQDQDDISMYVAEYMGILWE